MLALLLLAVASAGVAYIIAVYPLILALQRWRRAPAVAKDLDYRPKVSLLMAVRNGEQFIAAKLSTILALNYPRESLEILVISDGSSDRTESLVRECPDRRVDLIPVPHGGKAAALNAGLGRATGEILFFTDVRQPLDRSALTHLVANFADRSVGAVTGELRYLKSSEGNPAGEQADMDLYWRYELWARRRHSAIDSTLNTTGCVYAMRRSLARPLPVDTLVDDAFLPLGAFLNGYRVIFDPQAIAYDLPAPPGAEYARRMRTLAGMWQLITRHRTLLSGANRMRFHFLSHKVARLALPWFILLALISTVALDPSPFRTALLWNEAALFALAALDWIVPRWFPLKRITSPARTFMVMNAAGIMSLQVFFRSPQSLWRPTKVSKAA
jgi:cellulose synthase/poly-beta-1,6-N-acetylglucosamine synthase-like glycosyltransferase